MLGDFVVLSLRLFTGAAVHLPIHPGPERCRSCGTGKNVSSCANARLRRPAPIGFRVLKSNANERWMFPMPTFWQKKKKDPSSFIVMRAHTLTSCPFFLISSIALPFHLLLRVPDSAEQIWEKPVGRFCTLMCVWSVTSFSLLLCHRLMSSCTLWLSLCPPALQCAEPDEACLVTPLPRVNRSAGTQVSRRGDCA